MALRFGPALLILSGFYLVCSFLFSKWLLVNLDRKLFISDQCLNEMKRFRSSLEKYRILMLLSIFICSTLSIYTFVMLLSPSYLNIMEVSYPGTRLAYLPYELSWVLTACGNETRIVPCPDSFNNVEWIMFYWLAVSLIAILGTITQFKPLVLFFTATTIIHCFKCISALVTLISFSALDSPIIPIKVVLLFLLYAVSGKVVHCGIIQNRKSEESPNKNTNFELA